MCVLKKSLHRSEIRDGGETPCFSDSQPGTTSLEVTPGKDFRSVVPEGNLPGGPVIKFVAIGSQDESIIRVRSVCKDDKTHGEILTF